MWFLGFFGETWGFVERIWERVLALQDEGNEVGPVGFYWVLRTRFWIWRVLGGRLC